MEGSYLVINQLDENVQQWYIKVMVVEKSFIRDGHFSGRKYQRYVFVDDVGNRLQGVACLNDVHVFNQVLQLYSTYYIGNGVIRRLMNRRARLGSVGFELVLTQHCFIELVGGVGALAVDHLYNLTPFGSLQSLMCLDDAIITILAVVIEVFPMQVFVLGGRYVRAQEFLLLNQEMMPTVFEVWEEFIETDGLYLAQNVDRHPIVLICRPRISHFHGVSLATKQETIIMYDVDIPQAHELWQWYNSLGGDAAG